MQVVNYGIVVEEDVQHTGLLMIPCSVSQGCRIWYERKSRMRLEEFMQNIKTTDVEAPVYTGLRISSLYLDCHCDGDDCAIDDYCEG